VHYHDPLANHRLHDLHCHDLVPNVYGLNEIVLDGKTENTQLITEK